MIFIRLLKLIIAIFLISYSNILPAEDVTPAKFLIVTDIHFDPFSGCVKSPKPCVLVDKLRMTNYQEWPKLFDQYGNKTISGQYHDANYPLLKSSLDKIHELHLKEKPQFVMLLGDFIAHDYRLKYRRYAKDKSLEGYQAFVKQTIQFLTYEFAREFPDIDVYPVIGNNDSYTGDYHCDPNGKFYQDAANIWSVLIKDKTNRENFQREFPAAGYYDIALPSNRNQHIIVLNTVLFSNRIQGEKVQAAALEELDWLHKKLKNAEENHQQVFIADHIPIGIDVFATLIARFATIKQFWQPDYTVQFEKEISLFPDLVTGIFSGHIHVNKLQMLSLKKVEGVPVYFTPSISPIFGNNPEFKIFSYNPSTFKITDIETFDYPLGQTATAEWKEE